MQITKNVWVKFRYKPEKLSKLEPLEFSANLEYRTVEGYDSIKTHHKTPISTSFVSMFENSTNLHYISPILDKQASQDLHHAIMTTKLKGGENFGSYEPSVEMESKTYLIKNETPFLNKLMVIQSLFSGNVRLSDSDLKELGLNVVHLTEQDFNHIVLSAEAFSMESIPSLSNDDKKRQEILNNTIFVKSNNPKVSPGLNTKKEVISLLEYINSYKIPDFYKEKYYVGLYINNFDNIKEMFKKISEDLNAMTDINFDHIQDQLNKLKKDNPVFKKYQNFREFLTSNIKYSSFLNDLEKLPHIYKNYILDVCSLNKEFFNSVEHHLAESKTNILPNYRLSINISQYDAITHQRKAHSSIDQDKLVKKLDQELNL